MRFPQTCHLYCGESLYGFYFGRYRLKQGASLASVTGILGFSRPYVSLNPVDIECLKLAERGLQRFILSDYNEKDLITFGAGDTRYPTDRIRDWPGNLNASWTEGKALLRGFTIAGSIYGGLHTIAWQAPFASPTETTLWRISSLALICSGFVLISIAYVRPWLDRWSAGDPKFLLQLQRLIKWQALAQEIFEIEIVISIAELCIVWTVIIYCPLYIFSRVYLVVECFLNLAHLPDAVYTASSWSQYFPHIT